MKKRLFISLILTLLLLLSACGKTEATKAAEKAISEMGNVTVQSDNAISYAERLYELLTDAEKEKVENRLDLITARETYDAMVTEAISEKANEAFQALYDASELVMDGMQDIRGGWYSAIVASQQDDYTLTYYMPLYTSITGFDIMDTGLEWYDYSIENALGIVMAVHRDQRGTYDSLDTFMQEARSLLNELSEVYSDKEYYPALNDYYTSIQAYIDFFKSPSGSYNQLEAAMAAYENAIISCQSAVGLIPD